MGQGASSTRCPTPGALRPLQSSSTGHTMPSPSGARDAEASYPPVAVSSTLPASRRRSFSPDPDSVDSRRSSRIRRRISRFVSSNIVADHASPRDQETSNNSVRDDTAAATPGPTLRDRLPRIRSVLRQRHGMGSNVGIENNRFNRPSSVNMGPQHQTRQTSSLDLQHHRVMRPRLSLEPDLYILPEPPVSPVSSYQHPTIGTDNRSTPSGDATSETARPEQIFGPRRNIINPRHLRPRRAHVDVENSESLTTEDSSLPSSMPGSLPSSFIPTANHTRPNFHRHSPRESRGSSASGSSRLGRPGEDQAAVLSRLLSVAAAATAASLVGSNTHAFSDARDVSGEGVDGSFESFLRALQNGRLASALRSGGGSTDSLGTDSSDDIISTGSIGPLNFFRMFRFGPTSDTSSSLTGSPTDQVRMIPVIIVGIRSVNPRDTNLRDGRPSAPFLDALSASPFGDDIGNRRDSGSHTRPVPASPAEHFSENDSSIAGSIPSLAIPTNLQMDPSSPLSRPNSNLIGSQEPSTTLPPRSSASANEDLEWTANSAHSAPSSPSRYSHRNSRPTSPDPTRHQSEGTRSWIIYVLGGSYPENHPILTTPSLFTDTPTYEDMMLLSSLIAPVKPPVASPEDVESAGGLFTAHLEGTPTVPEGRSETVIQINPGERCLVCLSDFENDELCRRLEKCQHVFHKDCIDEWLTTGRNSCPLCRGKGVEEVASDVGLPREDTTTSGNSIGD